jgi:hypothetical protein
MKIDYFHGKLINYDRNYSVCLEINDFLRILMDDTVAEYFYNWMGESFEKQPDNFQE